MHTPITLAIGTDHRGFLLKQFLITHTTFNASTVQWHDVGTYSCDRTDYPLFVPPVIELVQKQQVMYGILLCGSGIGMSVMANRYQDIYAGLVWNEQVAQLAKQDDNVNVLVLPADFITEPQALTIIKTWLSAKFKGGRYNDRLELIKKLTTT